MVTKLNIIKNGKSLSFEAVEDPNGSFVLASDYASLFAELDLAKADRDALAERVERLSGMLTESRHATKAAVERADALAVENAALKSLSIKLFNLGYLHGHESTVEGYFVDIHRNDIDTYHDDVVAEIIEDEEETPATDAAIAAIEARGVEKFAESQKEYVRLHRAELDPMTRGAYCGSAVDAERYAKRLREAK